MRHLTIACRSAVVALGVLLTAACADQPTALDLPGSPSLARAGSARYQLRFVATAAGGEITSGLFPAGGVTLNTSDPWRQMSADAPLVTLTSPTHGVRWDGVNTSYVGTCRFAADVDVNWTIATAPRSFAGDWQLTVSTSRDRYGINFYLVGPRIVAGVASASNGVIQNIASNRNTPLETRTADDSLFAIEFTNARLGFGSQSSPDGIGTLGNLLGYETACANFRIEAVRM